MLLQVAIAVNRHKKAPDPIRSGGLVKDLVSRFSDTWNHSDLGRMRAVGHFAVRWY